MCRDGEDEWVAVEIKRIGDDRRGRAAQPLPRAIRLDPAFGSCRGVLAAQTIKPQARVLAESRGIELRRGRPRGAARRARARAEAVRGLSRDRLRSPSRSSDDKRQDAEQPVLTERRGNVLLITLNRPEVRNAVNAALAEGVAGRSTSSTPTTASRSACSPAPAASSAPAWTSARSSRASRRGSATAASRASPSAPRASR